MASKGDNPNEPRHERGSFPTGRRGQSDHGLVARSGLYRGIKKEVNLMAENPFQNSKEQDEMPAPSSNPETLDGEIDKMTKTRQMFADKKARREHRRSLRESEDYLGVQGANPRSGYWDISSGTSSSGPSQLSDETKRKLDEEARNIEEQKRKYEEAKAKHQAELSRVQSLRDQQKQEKEKRKSMELKMKQRRHGKWKLSEDGWRSVAEPELSPIVQSVVGSPARGQFKEQMSQLREANLSSQRLLQEIAFSPCQAPLTQLRILIQATSGLETTLDIGMFLPLWLPNVPVLSQSYPS